MTMPTDDRSLLIEAITREVLASLSTRTGGADCATCTGGLANQCTSCDSSA